MNFQKLSERMDFCPVPTLVQGLSTDFDAQSVTDEVIKDVANAIQQVFSRKTHEKSKKSLTKKSPNLPF